MEVHISELEQLLPCLENHKHHNFYKGETNLFKNKCGEKCEYINVMKNFMEEFYPDFRLVKCCDIGKRSANQSEAQPEAVFVNAHDSSKKIAIEVKMQPAMYIKDIKKDDKELRRRKAFENRIVKGVFIATQEKVIDLLRKLDIELSSEFKKFFLHGYELFITRIPDNKEMNGMKIGIHRPTIEEILTYKNHKESKLISLISEENAKYIVRNIIGVLHEGFKGFNYSYEYTIDKLKFSIIKKLDFNFSVRYRESLDGVKNTFHPDKEAIEARMEKRFKECEAKFSDYMGKEYKRILIIENKNYYSKSRMITIMKEIKVPEYIDELWSSFYVIEETWDEYEEDLVERILGSEFLKIYPV